MTKKTSGLDFKKDDEGDLEIYDHYREIQWYMTPEEALKLAKFINENFSEVQGE